jgi:hypothetical protein
VDQRHLVDVFGTKRAAPAATGLVGFGVLAAIPTALAGASDWSKVDRESQRVGVVHAAANSTALACYTMSLLARLRGRRFRGIAWGLLVGCAAVAGGYLGGHLTLARDAGRAVSDRCRPVQASRRERRTATSSAISPNCATRSGSRPTRAPPATATTERSHRRGRATA